MNRNRRWLYLQSVLGHVILFIWLRYVLSVDFPETRGRTVKYAKWITAIDLLERHCVFSRSVRSSDRLSLARTRRTARGYNRRRRRTVRESLRWFETVSTLPRHVRKIDLMELNIRASLYIFSRNVGAANRAISETRNAKSRGDPVILESAGEMGARERERERKKDLLTPRNTWHLIDALFHAKGRIIIAVSGTYACSWRLRRARITARRGRWREHEIAEYFEFCCR